MKKVKNVDKLDVNGDEKVKVALNTGIDEKSRSQIAKKLGKVLADSYLLMLKSHNYHWNVRGSMFKSIHEFTEEQYNDLFLAIDEIAERIRSIGFEAPGSFKEYTKLSSLKEADNPLSQEEMIADLVKSHEAIVASISEALDVSTKSDDEATADMMVGRLRFHEKTAWMWRSFLEK